MSNPAAVSLGRVGAMVLRYTYLLRSSWPRLLEMIYWPAVQMLTWGFLQTYLVQAQGGAPNSAAIAAGALIGGVLLWDILLRGQQGFSFSFLEEMWSRNIPNLLMSPLRPAEFVVALMVMSLIRLAVGVVPVTLMAIVFWLQSLGAGRRFRRLFRGSNLLCLERRLAGFGLPAALRIGRRKSCLVADVHHPAARLHLLSCCGSTRLAATHLGSCRRPMFSRACAAC